MIQYSVITVCRNAEYEIQETLRSVFQQDYDSYEFIIIDGKSNDNTICVVNEYIARYAAHDRVNVVSEKDDGIYDAMNKGIRKAQGEWLIFLNAGDSFYDSSVLSNMEKVIKGTNADVIYGNANYIENGVQYLVKSKSIETIKNGMPFCHQSVFNRRSIISEFMYNTHYTVCADYDLYTRQYYKGINFSKCDIIVCNYLIGGLSQKHQKKMIKEILEIRSSHSNVRHPKIVYCQKVMRMYLGRIIKSIIPVKYLR